MGIDIRGLTGKPVGSTKTERSQRSKTEATNADASGGTEQTSDTMSLTGSATKLQELEAHIASLPIVDATHIADVQRALATGSYHFEPIDAAESLIEQEKEFAKLDK